MVTLDAKMIVLVTLLALFLPNEVFSQSYFCLPGMPVRPECFSIYRGGPGGRWRGGSGGGFGGVTLPSPVCPPGEAWVESWGTCIPYIRGGPGGRWRGGPGRRWRSGRGRWRTGNLLPRPSSLGLGPVCPPGDIWVESLQTCVPWLRGSGSMLRSGPGGRWRSGGSRGRVCPAGEYWAPGFTHCIPYESPMTRGRVCPPGQYWAPGFTHCIPYETSMTRGRVCPPGEYWAPGFTHCIPFEPSMTRGRVCPPGQYWAPGFTHCIPYNSMDDDY